MVIHSNKSLGNNFEYRLQLVIRMALNLNLQRLLEIESKDKTLIVRKGRGLVEELEAFKNLEKKRRMEELLQRTLERTENVKKELASSATCSSLCPSSLSAQGSCLLTPLPDELDVAEKLRPLEDLAPVDLARIYAEHSYQERRRLFKEAVRRSQGRHVWTWEALTGCGPSSLAHTYSVPLPRAEEVRRYDPKQVVTEKVHTTVREIHKQLEAEEKALELKLLELEMMMNPQMAEQDLYDYQPEVMLEIKAAIKALINFDSKGKEKPKRRVWNPVPKATMERAIRRAEALKRSQENDYDSDDIGTPIARDGKLARLSIYDSRKHCFRAPQATLQRAKIHEALMEIRDIIESEKNLPKPVKPRSRVVKRPVFETKAVSKPPERNASAKKLSNQRRRCVKSLVVKPFSLRHMKSSPVVSRMILRHFQQLQQLRCENGSEKDDECDKDNDKNEVPTELNSALKEELSNSVDEHHDQFKRSASFNFKTNGSFNVPTTPPNSI